MLGHLKISQLFENKETYVKDKIMNLFSTDSLYFVYLYDIDGKTKR